MSDFEKLIGTSIDASLQSQADALFRRLIQKDKYIGELYSIDYGVAKVQIHDEDRRRVGGIPALSFLIATRVDPEQVNDFNLEDSSVLLLRVSNSAPLPNDSEAERIRLDTARRVTGETDVHWDSPGKMDPQTKVYLGFAALQCSIIGTFFVDNFDVEDDESFPCLKFGSDISNFYPNSGMKVYKPSGEALSMIVNYVDKQTLDSYTKNGNSSSRVRLGHVRYASTNRRHQSVDVVPVSIFPNDLIAQKTAVFGMTRTGKSNTVKVISKSVYELRNLYDSNDKDNRIGQIILDPNGEYANENTQDRDGKGNVNALKNIWQRIPSLNDKLQRLKEEYNAARDKEHRHALKENMKDLIESEVVTYGLLPHKNDPFRRLMKINFYDDDSLQIGKEIINFKILGQSAQYFTNFRDVEFIAPVEATFDTEAEYRGQLSRYNRRVLVYKALLNKAGFAPPNSRVNIYRIFSSGLRESMISHTGRSPRKVGLINAAGQTLSQREVTWDSLGPAFEGLSYFLSTADYNTFNAQYIASGNQEDGDSDATGEGWAESDLESLLEIFQYSKGANLIGGVQSQHTNEINTDYASDIYDDLVEGKLVIIDQSSGDPEINQATADRVMWKIFKRNQELFRNGKNLPPIIMYIEEAHNLLPDGNSLDLKNVWVRTAKEGAKYNIGMVYSTQEVSSIQRNVLKNTSNWFIGHLNNTDETKELVKYYDFKDFEQSIRKAQDKGFLRVKTMSNYFVVPVQVKIFDVTE